MTGCARAVSKTGFNLVKAADSDFMDHTGLMELFVISIVDVIEVLAAVRLKALESMVVFVCI